MKNKDLLTILNAIPIGPNNVHCNIVNEKKNFTSTSFILSYVDYDEDNNIITLSNKYSGYNGQGKFQTIYANDLIDWLNLVDKEATVIFGFYIYTGDDTETLVTVDNYNIKISGIGNHPIIAITALDHLNI